MESYYWTDTFKLQTFQLKTFKLLVYSNNPYPRKILSQFHNPGQSSHARLQQLIAWFVTKELEGNQLLWKKHFIKRPKKTLVWTGTEANHVFIKNTTWLLSSYPPKYKKYRWKETEANAQRCAFAVKLSFQIKILEKYNFQSTCPVYHVSPFMTQFKLIPTLELRVPKDENIIIPETGKGPLPLKFWSVADRYCTATLFDHGCPDSHGCDDGRSDNSFWNQWNWLRLLDWCCWVELIYLLANSIVLVGNPHF